MTLWGEQPPTPTECSPTDKAPPPTPECGEKGSERVRKCEEAKLWSDKASRPLWLMAKREKGIHKMLKDV